MQSLFHTKHLIRTLAVTALFGVGGFTIVGFANAADGPADDSPFAIAPFLEGDAGTYVLEPAPLDGSDIQRGLDPDRHARMDFIVDGNREVFDADGIERIATSLRVRTEDQLRTSEDRVLFDGDLRKTIGIEYVYRPDNQNNERDGEVEQTTWWGLDYKGTGMSMHCAFDAPFVVAELDGTKHVDERSCDFGPYELDGGTWYWQPAAVGVQDGVRVLELHMWYDPRPFDDQPDMQVWYREDTPVPIRMQDNSGYGGIKDGDAWVLTNFERGERPLDSGVTGTVLPDLIEAPATEVFLDDSSVTGFTLSDALAKARSEHLPLQEFEADHPDAFMMCARHAAFDMDRHTERWTFWLTDGTDRFGTAVAQDTTVDGSTGQATTTYRYDEEPGGCPYGNEGFPSAPLKEGPSVASLKAVADMVLGDLYNPDGVFGWEFQVFDDGTYKAHAGQSYYYREQEDPDLLTGLLTGQENRLDAWDDAAVNWDDGEMTGYGGSDQVHAYGTYADDPRAAPTFSMDSSQAVSGAWKVPPTKAVAGIALGTGVIGFAYWLSPMLRAPFVGLFSRVRKDQALQHPVRAELASLIKAEPGIHFQELVRRTKKGRGTVEHHLRTLADKGLVDVRSGSGYRCFFSPGSVDRRVMDAAPVLKSPAAKEILARLRQEARVTDLAEDMGLSKASVSRHVKRMEGAGLVTRRRDGRDQWLRATPVGAEAS